jgi:carotenoid cleavage dioxygenase-like enzyme
MNAVHQPNPVLRGNYAPIERELTLADLPVIGEIPKDLNGVYVRNGPNRRYAAAGRYHWFDGDGMLHGAWFENGKVTYRNRWVRARGFEEEGAAGRALWEGVMEPPRRDRPDMPLKDTSNTDVKFHAGRLLTTWYLAGDLYAVDPATLATEGRETFGGTLACRVSAHSKVDEATGEFIFFDYGKTAPYMSYGVVGPDRRVKHWTPITLPGPRLPHDIAITPNYSVLHDLPLFYDMEAFKAGRHKVKFYPEIPARFGVIPRHGAGDRVRWFEAEPCFIYHVVNAWEEGDELVMTGCRYVTPRKGNGEPDAERYGKMIAHLLMDANLYQWRFNLVTGATREGPLDDTLNAEFPMINSAWQTKRNRWSYNVMMARWPEDEPRFTGLVKFDLDTGRYQAFSEGPNFWYSEAPFAERDDPKSEDDGYLVSFVWNPNESRSELQVFDAQALAEGPIARVLLPQRVPNGFHATWVSAKRLANGR